MTESIYKQICEIQKKIDSIGKNEKNQHQGFNFRGIDTVYNSLHSLLSEFEVFCTSEILDERSEERNTARGGILIYRILKIKYRFYSSDGSFVETVVIGEGMDSGDKASNKAMAIAHKYALLQMFTVPTAEQKDPDAETHEVQGPPKKVQDPGKPTDKQRKMIWAVAKKIWPGENTKSGLENVCNSLEIPTSSSELNRKQATMLIDALETLKDEVEVAK